MFELNAFNVDPPPCGIVYSCQLKSTSPTKINICEINEALTVATFDSESGNYEFRSTDMAGYPAGSYELLILGMVRSKADSFTLKIELVDPCPRAEIAFPENAIEALTYILKTKKLDF